MAEVDTSSYLKPAALPAQKTLLDQVGQYQQLESNKIGIDTKKLDLMNSQFQLLNNGVSTLIADPDVTGDNANAATASKKINTQAAYMAKQLNLPPDMVNNFINQFQIPPNATPGQIRDKLHGVIAQGQTHQEMINLHYGANGTYNNGQQDVPVVTSPKPGFGGMRSAGPPLQRQLPPATPTIDPATNQPTLQGAQLPVTPPGTVAMPPPAPGARVLPPGPVRSPAIPGQSSNFGGNVLGASVEQPSFNDRWSNGRPTGPITGMTPLFEEGRKAYTAAQQNAATKMLAAKPAIQALPLMQTKGFLSGPGTEQFTKAVAGLKSWGLIETANENDPTAIRQEVSKKLAQYVSNSPVGQRSDAAQVLKEASSPNPKAQVLPALIKLTKDAVALDRVEAALPNAFQPGNKNKDFSQFIEHQGKFPQSVDERAFTLDLEPEEKSKAIVDGMADKLKSKNKREVAEANKFFRSLEIADKQGFYGGNK